MPATPLPSIFPFFNFFLLPQTGFRKAKIRLGELSLLLLFLPAHL
jgi:hypothetical protein